MYGVVRFVAIPLLCEKFLRSVLTKNYPLSECTYAGIPKIENNSQSFVTTVLVSTLEHGSPNGNLENSPTTVNIYLLFAIERSGPLKSRLIGSNGCVAFTRWAGSGVKKRGLHYCKWGTKMSFFEYLQPKMVNFYI